MFYLKTRCYDPVIQYFPSNVLHGHFLFTNEESAFLYSFYRHQLGFSVLRQGKTEGFEYSLMIHCMVKERLVSGFRGWREM